MSLLDKRSFLSLELNDSVTIAKIEKELSVFFSKNGPDIRGMVLNLRDCRYIEITSLARIISLVTDRERHGLSTHICLPKSLKVRNIMRIWSFPEAIAAASGIPFYHLVLPEDRVYFGENPREEVASYGQGVDERTKLLPIRFFAFLTKKLDAYRTIASEVSKENKRWEDELVKAVLEHNLVGPEIHLRSRIVYEMMTNALRHPNCTLIQVSSRFESNGSTKDDAPDHFTIMIWDDGKSMFKTLREPIDYGLPICADRFGNLGVFTIKHVDAKDNISKSTIRADFVPTVATPDFMILVSTLLPGITRDPAGKGHLVHEDLYKTPELTFPGMGLFVLINTVIDVFGGSVAFRTDRFFMNVKTPSQLERERGIDYRVKIKEYDGRIPRFLGNMLTIRLPIKTSEKSTSI